MSKRIRIVHQGYVAVTFGPISGPAALAVLVYAVVQVALNIATVLR